MSVFSPERDDDGDDWDYDDYDGWDWYGDEYPTPIDDADELQLSAELAADDEYYGYLQDTDESYQQGFELWKSGLCLGDTIEDERGYSD